MEAFIALVCPPYRNVQDKKSPSRIQRPHIINFAWRGGRWGQVDIVCRYFALDSSNN
jgi:hypothetical protein